MNLQRHKLLARFGLMHLAATNVCIWIRTIIEETFRDVLFAASVLPVNIAGNVTVHSLSTTILPPVRAAHGPHWIVDARSGAAASGRFSQLLDNVSAPVTNLPNYSLSGIFFTGCKLWHQAHMFCMFFNSSSKTSFLCV